MQTNNLITSVVSFLGNCRRVSHLKTKQNKYLAVFYGFYNSPNRSRYIAYIATKRATVIFNNSLTAFELAPSADFVITGMNGGLIVIPSSVFGNA